MYIITGAAGFIGSVLVRYLNEQGVTDLWLVDDFGRAEKRPNLSGKTYARQWDRDTFLATLPELAPRVKAVFHIGARTDTTEQEEAIFDELNVAYSKAIWRVCATAGIPLIYASSAATYGDGSHGYRDDHALVSRLQPLNAYGRSKNDFDAWALAQTEAPPQWYGLKFFNVYGPNEYHKGRMASVILHTTRQIEATGEMKLFRSHRPGVADGEQSRDFVYVKDLVQVLWWLYEQQPASGLYNLGTGQARSFKDLASLTFRALGKEPNLSFVDTPEDIRDTYQYFTEAEMGKLRRAGYTAPFHSLEEGIADYVGGYLREGRYY